MKPTGADWAGVVALLRGKGYRFSEGALTYVSWSLVSCWLLFSRSRPFPCSFPRFFLVHFTRQPRKLRNPTNSPRNLPAFYAFPTIYPQSYTYQTDLFGHPSTCPTSSLRCGTMMRILRCYKPRWLKHLQLLRSGIRSWTGSPRKATNTRQAPQCNFPFTSFSLQIPASPLPATPVLCLHHHSSFSASLLFYFSTFRYQPSNRLIFEQNFQTNTCSNPQNITHPKNPRWESA